MARPGYRLALLATLLAAVVVLLGAYTRLTHSGLGCPDWPGCYGFVTVPLTEAQRAHAELQFPAQPLEARKGWSEMVHRYAAGCLALLIGLLAAQALRRDARERRLPLLLLGLLCLQAAFGMWTVTLRLWPHVVTAHLLGGLTILALLWWLALRLAGVGSAGVVPPSTRRWARWAIVLVLAQAALGGWVSANYAAMACVDFPTCQGQWWPASDFANAFHLGQQIGPNYLGGQLDSEARTAIHLTHRLGAAFLGSVLLVLACKLVRAGLGRLAALLLGLLALQVALGIGNVWLNWPLALAVAHNAGAGALLLGLVWVNQRLSVAVLVPVHRAQKAYTSPEGDVADALLYLFDHWRQRPAHWSRNHAQAHRHPERH
jgi:cytochrome c oxidase assembly protein subunit 15